MLSGKHAPPGRAHDAIARLHLAGSVFAFPGTLGWEESRLLLSALPILIKGQVDEREKLATTARPAGWHGEHADVLASPLTPSTIVCWIIPRRSFELKTKLGVFVNISLSVLPFPTSLMHN